MKACTPVKCTENYDLFGLNIKDVIGCCVCKYDDRGKYLVWFPPNGEYAELNSNQIEEALGVDKNFINECRDHCSNIRKL